MSDSKGIGLAPTNQPTRCRSVLIVEDDHDIRVTLQEFLEVEGYLVFSAANGRQGLELLGRIQPPGVVLLDFMMPLMNGQEFLRAKGEDPALARIPVVMISASKEAAAMPADAFLPKPISLEILLQVVTRFCASPISSPCADQTGLIKSDAE